MKKISAAGYSLILASTPTIMMVAPRATVLLLALIAISLSLFSGFSLRTLLPRYREWWIIATLLVWAGITSLWGLSPEAYILALRLGALLLLTSFVYQHVHENKEAPPPLSVLEYGALLASFIITLDALNHGAISKLFSFLSSRSFHFELSVLNRSVVMLSLVTPPLILRALNQKRRFDALALLCFTILAMAVTVNLGAKLAFGFSLLLGFIAYRSAPLLQYVLAGTLVLIFTLPWLTHAYNPYELAQQFPQLPASSMHRLFIWNYAGTQILNSPWLGYGLDAARFWPDEKGFPLLGLESIPPIPLHTHNMILQWWLELGLPGILCIALLTFSVWRKIIAIEDPYTRASAAALCQGFTLIALVGFGAWQEWLWASLVIAMVWRHARERIKDEKPSHTQHL